MDSSDQNIFSELKKKFYRCTYSDKYGGSIFSTFFILTSITLLIQIGQIKDVDPKYYHLLDK